MATERCKISGLKNTQFAYFFTEIDPRAKVKGSRDPLGFQPLWIALGRALVGNLTTVTTSPRGFTTHMLALYFVDEAIRRGMHSEEARLELFLKIEQLAAYSRYAYNRKELETAARMLGITRVSKRLNEARKVMISAERHHQILSDQKTYGLWGLYSVASRKSGLCETEDYKPTPRARSMLEEYYLPRLSKGLRNDTELFRFLERDRWFEPWNRHKELAKRLAALLEVEFSKKEREFYGHTLVLARDNDYDETAGRQQRFWRLIETVNDQGMFDWKRPYDFIENREIIKRARVENDQGLVRPLERIQVVEPFFALLSHFFGFLINRHQARLDDIRKELEAHLAGNLKHIDPRAIAEVRPQLQEVTSSEMVERLIELAKALRSGDFGAATFLVIEQNQAVMQARGGMAWLTVDKGRIKVRLYMEGGRLPEAASLPTLWVNTYFLNSLKELGARVMGKVSR